MSSEDLNLPASLERLEINPERIESSKADENPFSYGGATCPLSRSEATPECSLETLSLNAICPKGNCLCNKKKDSSGRNNPNNSNGNSSSLKSIVHHRRPIIRRSKLNREVLRAPILRLGNETSPEAKTIGKTSTPYKKLDVNSSVNNSTTDLTTLLCCSQPLSAVPATSTATTARLSANSSTIIPPAVKQSNYASTAATSSHCCALQARSINNNNNNCTSAVSITTMANTSTSTATDDTNIDELASYFDVFVHIPKKMSVMAEMMYI